MSGVVSGAVVVSRPRTLVTGAAARVGLATAIEFATRGHDLVLAVRTDDARARCAVDAVRASAIAAGHHNAHIELRPADLNEASAVDGLAASFKGEQLDVVVHCAGRYDARPIQELDSEYVLSHFRVNALAPLMLTTALRAQLAASPLPAGGAVVCFTDMHVEGRMYRDHAAYFASKGALTALVGALALELAPAIRVNGIAPGVVAFPQGCDRDFQARYIARTPLARAGTVQEAAKCAAWLALEASFVTGAVLRLDGGRWLTT
ncbi:MAG: SDR family oxidoreductase [Phycisphaerales bacterium]|nr:SDR family oxidoreductase [Phycisphaerales bacterium]